MKSPIWPEFKLVPDFITVLIMCKFENDLIKNEVAIIRATFSPLYIYRKNFHGSRANNSKVNRLIWHEIELIRGFMTVFVTCEIEEAPIKMKSLSSGRHFPHYIKVYWSYRQDTKGQVTQKSIV